MKTVLKIGEMVDHSPVWLKDAFVRVAKDSGLKTDSLELHRHTHSEKSEIQKVDVSKRQSLKYVSARTQDRDDEIVIPKGIILKEFQKYMHVLVNHNYSLLPIGSDQWIEADDFGIKALTNHANTGEGTLANVVWHLVEQGHMKASSIGFVPTSHTKPGARDWDRVANSLQSTWKEFDKGRAEKAVSRIITSGVLLEHSFVSVPCNTDAEMIQVVKGMVNDDNILSQLGWSKSFIEKATVQTPEEKHVDKFDLTSEKGDDVTDSDKAEPCVCSECGKKRKCPAGVECGEDCKGKMKPDKKEQKSVTVLSRNGHPVIIKESGMENGKDEDGGYASEDVADAVACKCNKCDVKRKCPPGVACAEEGCDGKMEEVAEEKAAGDSACTCDVCKAKADCVPGTPCKEEGCEGRMRLNDVEKGGPGSGNFGHGGVPGQVGGSSSGGGDVKLPPTREHIESMLTAGKVSRAAYGASNEASMNSLRARESGTVQAHDTAAASHIKASEAHTEARNALRKVDELKLTDSQIVDNRAKEGKHLEQYRQHEKEATFHERESDKLSDKDNKLRKIEREESYDKDPVARAGGNAETRDIMAQFAASRAKLDGKKGMVSEVKVVRPAPVVKVLYVPTNEEQIVKGIGDVVQRAISRRTGKLM